MRKRLVGLATTALVTGGLGLSGLGLASGTAQAEPGPFPAYHWCPGDDWHPEWGFNFDWGTCHDDHHRDFEGDNHGNDYWAGDQGRDNRGGPPPWQPWGDQGRGDQGGPRPWQPWLPWQQ